MRPKWTEQTKVDRMGPKCVEWTKLTELTKMDRLDFSGMNGPKCYADVA